jgi:hypothetical protein
VLAVAAGEARRTQAGEGVDAVHAGTPVEAGATPGRRGGGELKVDRSSQTDPFSKTASSPLRYGS